MPRPADEGINIRIAGSVVGESGLAILDHTGLAVHINDIQGLGEIA
ncbi:hypothetical protein [Desulfosarcina cetonica]